MSWRALPKAIGSPGNAIAHNSGVGATKNPYNQHRFGGTLGGPIRRDRTFSSAASGYRFFQYGNYSGSLPSAAQIAGNFSENLPTAAEQANCTTTPSAAANTAAHFLVCDPKTLTPYLNNTLPSVDPTAVSILNYLVKNLPARQPAQTGENPDSRESPRAAFRSNS